MYKLTLQILKSELRGQRTQTVKGGEKGVK